MQKTVTKKSEKNCQQDRSKIRFDEHEIELKNELDFALDKNYMSESRESSRAKSSQYRQKVYKQAFLTDQNRDLLIHVMILKYSCMR